MSNARPMAADAYVSPTLKLLLQGFPLTVLLIQTHALHVLVKLHVPPNTILPIKPLPCISLCARVLFPVSEFLLGS